MYVDGILDREITPVIRLSVVARDGGIFDADQVILNRVGKNSMV